MRHGGAATKGFPPYSKFAGKGAIGNQPFLHKPDNLTVAGRQLTLRIAAGIPQSDYGHFVSLHPLLDNAVEGDIDPIGGYKPPFHVGA